MSFSFTFKNIFENGSFAGQTIILPTPDNKPCKIDELPKEKQYCTDCGFELIQDFLGQYACWNCDCIRNKNV